MSSPQFKPQAWKPPSPTLSDRIRPIGHPDPQSVWASETNMEWDDDQAVAERLNPQANPSGPFGSEN